MSWTSPRRATPLDEGADGHPCFGLSRNGQIRADLAEIAALKKEDVRLRAGRNILKKVTVGSTGQRNIFELRCSERTHDGANRLL